MHHGLGAAQRFGWRICFREIVAHATHARAERVRGGARIANQRSDLMAPSDEASNQMRADKTGRPCDRDFQGCIASPARTTVSVK